MPHSKSISVAMCTYNGEKYLKEQLESIGRQTRLPAELIVCDDRSTDRSTEIIAKFAETAPFPVKLHVNEVNLGSASKGITRNFEQAVSFCAGELITPCDQDDIWMPQKLARMAQIMEDDPAIGGLFSDAQLVTDLGVPKGVLLSQTTGLTRRRQSQLLRGDGLPIIVSGTKAYGCTLMFDSRLLGKILPVPQHWWFDAWVSCVATVYSKLSFIPEQLLQYRIHAAQSGGASLPTVAERVQRWKSSAKSYWEESEPQLTDLYSRLAAEDDPSLKRYLTYISGRMDLLRFRADLPANRVTRLFKVIPQTNNYFKYFNGFRSVVKDITA